MKTGKALLSVVAGIAAGAIFGLLFAPEKGGRTRKNISKKGEDLANALNDRLDQRFDEMMKIMSGKFVRVKNDKEPRIPEMAEG